MPVLVAYEESGKVTAALRAVGIEAYSNDLLPTRGNPAWHIQGNAMEVIFSRIWDGIIAHPVCTYMSNSGAKHLYKGMKKENGICPVRWKKMEDSALEFHHVLNKAPAKYIVVENPIMHCYAKNIVGVRQSQIIQPWQFGHEEMKATCLWLVNLPPLQHSNVVGPPIMQQGACEVGEGSPLPSWASASTDSLRNISGNRGRFRCAIWAVFQRGKKPLINCHLNV